LPPARRASDSPIAIACFRLVTFLPDRPLLSVPRRRSRIALSTFADAFLPYLAIRSSHLSVSAQPFVGVIGRAARGRLRGLVLFSREPVFEVVAVLATARLEARERALADPLKPIGIVRAVPFRFLEHLLVLVHVS
jgi:hypothetical protein